MRLNSFFYGENYQKISSLMYHDLVASYAFSGLGGSTRLTAGITNITDELVAHGLLVTYQGPVVPVLQHQ